MKFIKINNRIFNVETIASLHFLERTEQNPSFAIGIETKNGPDFKENITVDRKAAEKFFKSLYNDLNY